MDAAVSALTCAPELSAAATDSTNFGARTELPALERGLAGDLVSPPAPSDVTEPAARPCRVMKAMATAVTAAVLVLLPVVLLLVVVLLTAVLAMQFPRACCWR